MITFKRKKENFPYCKTCKKPMQYYIFGLSNSEHEHPKCAGIRMANETLEKISKILKTC
jgi:endo-1,4-beta-mannosidase